MARNLLSLLMIQMQNFLACKHSSEDAGCMLQKRWPCPVSTSSQDWLFESKSYCGYHLMGWTKRYIFFLLWLFQVYTWISWESNVLQIPQGTRHLHKTAVGLEVNSQACLSAMSLVVKWLSKAVSFQLLCSVWQQSYLELRLFGQKWLEWPQILYLWFQELYFLAKSHNSCFFLKWKTI